MIGIDETMFKMDHRAVIKFSIVFKTGGVLSCGYSSQNAGCVK